MGYRFWGYRFAQRGMTMKSSAFGGPYPDPQPGTERPEFPTAVHMLAQAADSAPHAPALLCAGERLTYGEYGRCVAGLATVLKALGGGGERVGFLMRNSNEALVGLFGALAAGAQAAFFNPFYTQRELSPLIADAAPRILLCHAAFAPAAADLGVAHLLVFGGAGGLSLDQWRSDGSLSLAGPFPAAGDPATLLYTGGTTGTPKGVDHSHGEIMSFVTQTDDLWPMRPDAEIWINAAPIFHVWGSGMGGIIPVYRRGTMVTIARFDAAAMIAEMEDNRVSVLSGGPAAFYNGLIGAPNFASADLGSLKYCFGGGSPFAADTLERWQRQTGAPILEAYGMSEAAPISGTRAGGPPKAGSVGRPVRQTHIQIVDLESGENVLPVNQPGEIRLSGPQAMKGYRNRPEETRAALRDGWLYTGDIGRMDEDGYLYIVDRAKDMAIVGGYNVYPREVDEVLFSHPAIREAAAVGVPDEYKGEIIWAHVVLEDGAEASEAQILAYCAENLVAYKRPVGITFRDQLPKTPANKIDRKALR